MKDFEKGLLVFIIAVVLGACVSGGPVDFKDGSWSNCTYSKDGRIIKAPLQVGPVPMGWTEPDGTKVECEPIPESVG